MLVEAIFTIITYVEPEGNELPPNLIINQSVKKCINKATKVRLHLSFIHNCELPLFDVFFVTHSVTSGTYLPLVEAVHHHQHRDTG